MAKAQSKGVKAPSSSDTPEKVNPPHRPPIEFDWEALKRCCAIMCTQEEAAAIVGVSVDTLHRRFKDMGTTWAEFFNEHSGVGKVSLRRALFTSALGQEAVPAKDGEPAKPGSAPNVTAQIWLSKQHLGMKDRTEHGFDPTQPAKFVLGMGKSINTGESE